MLYRPNNFISSGLKIGKYNNKEKKLSIRHGIAIRPYKGQNFITIGLDTEYNQYNENNNSPDYQLLPFLNINLLHGFNFQLIQFQILEK